MQRIPLQRDGIQMREMPVPVEVLQARPNVIRPIQAIRLQSVPERESFGLTNEDLMSMTRQEFRSLAQDDLNSDSNSSENDDDDTSDESSINNMGQRIPSNDQAHEQPKVEELKRTCLCLSFPSLLFSS